jgi:acyl carrier protein
MAIEEEFSIEIPDKEADAIHSGKTSRRTKISLAVANDLQLIKR